MSSASNQAEIQWNTPRSLWVLLFQFFYSLLAMVPMYYYMRDIEDLVNETYVPMTFVVPILSSLILFMMMVLLDDVYWYQEKKYSARDFFKAGMKSTIWVTLVFYVIFYVIMGYWLNTNFPDYAGYYKSDFVHKFFIDYGVSMSVVILWTVFRYYFSKNRVTI